MYPNSKKKKNIIKLKYIKWKSSIILYLFLILKHSARQPASKSYNKRKMSKRNKTVYFLPFFRCLLYYIIYINYLSACTPEFYKYEKASNEDSNISKLSRKHTCFWMRRWYVSWIGLPAWNCIQKLSIKNHLKPQASINPLQTNRRYAKNNQINQ